MHYQICLVFWAYIPAMRQFANLPNPAFFLGLRTSLGMVSSVGQVSGWFSAAQTEGFHPGSVIEPLDANEIENPLPSLARRAILSSNQYH
jgi:hypothetical protein